MEETREMDQDPFSMERAYATFEENMRTARRLWEEIRQGQEKVFPEIRKAPSPVRMYRYPPRLPSIPNPRNRLIKGSRMG